MEHAVGHPGPDLRVDGVGDAFLGADHTLIENVLADGGINGVHSAFGGRRDGHVGSGALGLQLPGFLDRGLDDGRDGGGVGRPYARNGARVRGVCAASKQAGHSLSRR